MEMAAAMEMAVEMAAAVVAEAIAAAEGHDVSAVAASDTATISEYVQSLDPGRFAQLSEVAGVEASASEQ